MYPNKNLSHFCAINQELIVIDIHIHRRRCDFRTGEKCVPQNGVEWPGVAPNEWAPNSHNLACFTPCRF